MTLAYRVLDAELAQLTVFLGRYQERSTPSDWLREHKKTLYSGYVVSLYGALERYAEDVAEWLVDAYAAAGTVAGDDELKERVLEAHYKLSLECLNRPTDPRFGGNRSRGTLLEGMVASEQRQVSAITGDVFRAHLANFKFDYLLSFLGATGVNVLRAVDWSVRDAPYDELTEEQYEHVVRSSLDRLAQARNDCAHGALQNLEGPSDLGEWLDAVAYICSAIERDALDLAAMSYLAQDGLGAEVTVAEVFQDGHVAVLKADEGSVSLDSLLVSIREMSPRACWAPVTSIQVNDEPVEIGELAGASGVGVRTGCRRRENHRHWLVDRTKWESLGFPELHNPA